MAEGSRLPRRNKQWLVVFGHFVEVSGCSETGIQRSTVNGMSGTTERVFGISAAFLDAKRVIPKVRSVVPFVPCLFLEWQVVDSLGN